MEHEIFHSLYREEVQGDHLLLTPSSNVLLTGRLQLPTWMTGTGCQQNVDPRGVRSPCISADTTFPRGWNGSLFTVGEAVRSTCGNSHDDDDEENEEDRFHLSHLQTIL